MRDNRKVRFMIAGGGTGGHIFPAVAIARALQQKMPEAEFLFVGAKGKMEMEKIPKAGYQIVGLPISGFNRSSLIKNVSLPFKLASSFFKIAQVIGSFKPDAVIGVGGYSTYPVLRYAQFKGLPTFLHEANSFPGKSNQYLSTRASIVFVSSKGMEKFFPAASVMVSGNPIRTELLQCDLNKTEAMQFFGLQPNRPTVLVVGGSLGAISINKAVAHLLPEAVQRGVQFIWQTGKSGIASAEKFENTLEGVNAMPFIDRMDVAYQAADVVISRSGAMSVAELCALGKPSIFVPFPFAAEDHQTANAKLLVDQQAATMLSDEEVVEKLGTVLFELLGNEGKRKMYADKMKQMALLEADEFIANQILKNIGAK